MMGEAVVRRNSGYGSKKSTLQFSCLNKRKVADLNPRISTTTSPILQIGALNQTQPTFRTLPTKVDRLIARSRWIKVAPQYNTYLIIKPSLYGIGVMVQRELEFSFSEANPFEVVIGFGARF